MRIVNKKSWFYILFFLGFSFAVLIPFIVNASSDTASTTTLVSDFLGLRVGNFAEYFNNLFKLALVLGAILAVLVIATAGLQYMTTDAVLGKGDSKNRIWQAILGLLMLLSVWIFFKEINPNILNINLALPKSEQPTNKTPSESKNSPVSVNILCGGYKQLSCETVLSLCSSDNTPGFLSVVQTNTNSVSCSIKNSIDEASFKNRMEVELNKLLFKWVLISKDNVNLKNTHCNDIKGYNGWTSVNTNKCFGDPPSQNGIYDCCTNYKENTPNTIIGTSGKWCDENGQNCVSSIKNILNNKWSYCYGIDSGGGYCFQSKESCTKSYINSSNGISSCVSKDDLLSKNKPIINTGSTLTSGTPAPIKGKICGDLFNDTEGDALTKYIRYQCGFISIKECNDSPTWLRNCKQY